MIFTKTDYNKLESISEEINKITLKEIGQRNFAKVGEVLEDMQTDIYKLSKAVIDLCQIMLDTEMENPLP